MTFHRFLAQKWAKHQGYSLVGFSVSKKDAIFENELRMDLYVFFDAEYDAAKEFELSQLFLKISPF